MIPAEALAQHVAIVGTVGAGKTFTAKGVVEDLLDAGRRVCIIDPTSAWWGLRLLADGKSPGFKIAILGGEHGDIPLGESMGAKVGEMIGTRNMPAVIDLSEMLVGERHKFVTDFAEALFRFNRTPLHLVIDEADEFCPQNPLPESRRMLHHIDRIIRRGRIRGFRVTMITQRPATLHKNELTQANTLIAMRLTSPQDRKAVEEWVKGNADTDQAKEVLGSLASLKRGTGWLWCPSLGILKKTVFPAIRTFDSSRSPEEGDDIPEPVALAPVDIAELRASLAEPLLSKSPKTDGLVTSTAPAPDIEDIRKAAYGEGYKVGHFDGQKSGRTETLFNVYAALDAERDRTKEGTKIADIAAPVDQRIDRRIPDPKAARSTRAGSANGSTALDGAAVKLLQAFQSYPDRGLTWDEACIVASIIPGNGYFYSGKKKLVEGGYVQELQGRTFPSIIKPPAHLRREAIVRQWSSKLKQPAGRMLEYLAAQGARVVAVDELASAIGAKPGNGYWYSGVAALRDANLIEDRKGELKLSLFLVEAR